MKYLLPALLLFFCSCGSERYMRRALPALAPDSLETSEALRWLRQSDQDDRTLGHAGGARIHGLGAISCLMTRKTYRDFVIQRDSARQVAAWQIHRLALLRDSVDSFNVGLLFLHHPYAVRIPADSIVFLEAQKIFSALAAAHPNSPLPDLAASSTFAEEAKKRYLLAIGKTQR